MGIKRAADIIATSLTKEEKALLVDFGRNNALSPEELTEVFHTLLALRLIEDLFSDSNLVITRFGREVLSHVRHP